MVSFREMFMSFVIIGVFIVAAMSFVVVMQQENNVTDDMLQNDIINNTFTDLGGDLSQIKSDSDSQRDSFEDEIPERGFGNLIIFSVVGVGKKFTGMIVGVYNTIIVLPAGILGVPEVVIGALTSILTLTLILLAWRVYRSGS